MRYGHVINPITGQPEGRSLLAAVITQFAADGDALSTALLAHGETWLPSLAKIVPDCRALLIANDDFGRIQYSEYRW